MYILIVFCSVHHRMRIVSGKSCREKSKHVYYVHSLFFINLTIYDLMWKNVVELDMPQMTIWHMRIACWILKATYTHSKYAILIAFQCIIGCTNVPQSYAMHTLPLVRVCYMIYIYMCIDCTVSTSCTYTWQTYIVNLTFS